MAYQNTRTHPGSVLDIMLFVINFCFNQHDGICKNQKYIKLSALIDAPPQFFLCHHSVSIAAGSLSGASRVGACDGGGM